MNEMLISFKIEPLAFNSFIMESPYDIKTNKQDCNIFWTPVTLLYSVSDQYPWERYVCLYPPNPAMGYIAQLLFFYKDVFSIK